MLSSLQSSRPPCILSVLLGTLAKAFFCIGRFAGKKHPFGPLMVSFWCYSRLQFHHKQVLQNFSCTTCTFMSSKLPGKTRSGTDPRTERQEKTEKAESKTPNSKSPNSRCSFICVCFIIFSTKELNISFMSSIFAQGAPGRCRTEWAPDIGVPWRTWVERTRGGPVSREAVRKAVLNEMCSCFPRLETRIIRL